MVSFDATILIQILNFLILLLILNKVFFQPIIKVQKERQAAIDNASTSAAAKHAEVKQLREDYHQKLDQARQDAFQLVSGQVDASNSAREAKLAEVQAGIDERLNAAKQELASQESALRAALSHEVEVLAQLIIDKLIPAEDKTQEQIEVGVS